MMDPFLRPNSKSGYVPYLSFNTSSSISFVMFPTAINHYIGPVTSPVNQPLFEIHLNTVDAKEFRLASNASLIFCLLL